MLLKYWSGVTLGDWEGGGWLPHKGSEGAHRRSLKGIPTKSCFVGVTFFIGWSGNLFSFGDKV